LKLTYCQGAAETELAPILMRYTDLDEQYAILAVAAGFRPSSPGVVTASRNEEHTTDALYAMTRLVLCDKSESYSFSLAKKADFFLEIRAPL